MSASTAPQHGVGQSDPGSHALPLSLVGLPFLAALLALAGSLWLSMGMGLKACPLCVYQRSFVMGVVAVLGIGLLTGPRYRGVLNLLALPLACAALGVACFHVYLEQSGKLECPAGLVGIGTAPQQSLTMLVVLVLLLGIGIIRGASGAREPFAALTGILMGLLLAWGAIASAPPMPGAPTKAYETPLDTCRPPYRG